MVSSWFGGWVSIRPTRVGLVVGFFVASRVGLVVGFPFDPLKVSHL